ncbi:myroilysin precursor [Fusarium mundagurra]|uniref:Myroilysin n=1 Tax=Fusarium mundagurra TaxID=1567541 RepID=A0A8H5Y9F6_9HYPO|nr:myroilysin precursor [Fusarium mundagurra]
MKITSFVAALAGAQSVAAYEYVYLVNSVRGNEVSSGMAYYGDKNPPGKMARPSDYTDVTHGSFTYWEGKTIKGTFRSKVTFTSQIDASAVKKDVNAWAGTGSNGFKKFNCYKSIPRNGGAKVLYEVDGWKVYNVYSCINQKQ